MKIRPTLKQLATLFPVPLYVVGGAVRDCLLGVDGKDIDLASSLTPDEVKKALEGTQFRALPTSPKLGTLKIKGGGEEYEYTSFRSDSYTGDGSHTPESVRFTDSIYEDALRRDFTANAVYYDISEERFVDPLGGIKDIENRILRAARDPYGVLREDGLRLLRMVRIACSCGFETEPALYSAAKKNASLLKNINNGRIGDEFAKILVCDTENGVSGAHSRAVRMLIDFGLINYILPELMEGDKFPQRADFHKYDVLEHTLKVFELSPPAVRIAALFHDISKPSQKLATGKMAGHEFAGAEVLRKKLSQLCFPKDVIERQARLVECHMYDLKCETREQKLRLFIQKNYDIMDDLIDLKNADYEGSGMEGPNPSSKRMREVFERMKAEGVPFTIKDLQVGGKELINLGIPENKRSAILKELLESAANDKNLLSKQAQFEFLRSKTPI